MGVTNTSLHFLPHFLPSAYSNPLHQNTAGASGKLQPTSAPRLKNEIIRELTGIDLFVVRVSIRMNVRIVGGCFFRQANLQRLHFFCKRTQLLVILAAPGNLSNFHLEWMEGAMQDFPSLSPPFLLPLHQLLCQSMSAEIHPPSTHMEQILKMETDFNLKYSSSPVPTPVRKKVGW